jgi:hypothetical protein
VDEIVNTIRGHSEKVEQPMIVQKVLRPLPLRFDAKVFVIEKLKDLKKLTTHELHEILTTSEMSIEKENPTRKEETFKASKKTKGHKFCGCSNYESNTKEAQFVRKLKRGSGKYKGQLPFKFFNRGKVGHFVAKFPYAKSEDNDDDESNDK